MDAVRSTCSQQQQYSTWSLFFRVSYDFFRTFVEPFTAEGAFTCYQEQWTQFKGKVREQGVGGYLWSSVRERPVETLGKLALVSGVSSPLLGESAQLPLWAVKTASAFAGQLEFVWKSAASIDGSSALQKGLKLSGYSVFVYMVASFPAAAAADWNSLADVHKHYSGGACPPQPYGELMSPVDQCVVDTGGLQDCSGLIPAGAKCDVTLFTRHASKNPAFDPVSTTRMSQDRVCFFTALDETGVTKICFASLKNPDQRTVEAVAAMSLGIAHEGLNPGQTVRVLEMRSETGTSGCARFRTAAPDPRHVPDVCVLTALQKGGTVSQICFNTNDPSALTLKPRPGVQLEQDVNGPHSVVIKNPTALGLDVSPELVDAVPCTSNGVSWWDAAMAWWTQKWPCSTTDTSVIKDKEL